MPSNKTGVFRSTIFFGKKRKIFVVKRILFYDPNSSKFCKTTNFIEIMMSRFCKKFFLEQNGTEWIFMILWISRGVFSKNIDGWKRFLMVFWSVSKNWIYIIDLEMKSEYWSFKSELFLADRLGEDCWNGSFLMLDDESCFEKDGYQTCPLKSLCSQFTVMLRSVKRSRRKELSFCAKQSEVAESLLYQNITTIPLNCVPSAQFPAWFSSFLTNIQKSQNRFIVNWFSDINHKNRCSESFPWQNC